jgi:hypothetical protein
LVGWGIFWNFRLLFNFHVKPVIIMKNHIQKISLLSFLLVSVWGFKAFTQISITQSNINACEGQPINFTPAITGGSGSYSYFWSGPNNFTSNIQAPSINKATKKNEGNYTVIVKDLVSIALSSSKTIVIKILPLPTIKEIVKSIAGNTISLFPVSDNPNISYSWTEPSGSNQASLTMTKANATLTDNGIYTLTITDSKSGCTNILKKDTRVDDEENQGKGTGSENGLEDSQGLMPGSNFLRLNLGTNFDYIAPNPLKLLYADASIMAPIVFRFHRKIKTLERFGIYGRIYQFQGVSSPSDKERDKLFFYSPNGENITGADSIIKKQGKDSLFIYRPFYSRQADLIQVKNYGMAIGITTPIADNSKRTFYMSLGIHFEGQMTIYERENIYKKIYSKELVVSEKDFLNKNQSSELGNLSRKTRFVGTIGLSLPIIWQFSAFELKVLPALSIWEYDDLKDIVSTTSDKKSNTSYSIHAVLTEIKETGINFGCEIRGYTNSTPTTFSIFAAKTINMKKLGEILKL